MLRIEERFLSNSITRQHEFLLMLIPESKSKHAMELLYTVLANFFVQMNNHLRVGIGVEQMSFRLQLHTQSLIIVDLPIVDNPDSTIFIADRLVSRFKIDNTKSATTKTDVSIHVTTRIIRSTMHDGIEHCVYFFG